MSDDFDARYPSGDPFVDPNDPEAVEREERRREREAKRREKAAKKQRRAPAPPPPKETPAPLPRTPEQEFWDDPAEPATPPPADGAARPSAAQPPRSDRAERGRRRLLRWRKESGAAAGAVVAGGAPTATGAPAAPPTGETPAMAPTDDTRHPRPDAADEPPATADGEQPAPAVTGETRRPAAGEPGGASGPAPGSQPAVPADGDRSAPTVTGDRDAVPVAGEEPVPPLTEAPHARAAAVPQRDPGPGTAETPRIDPVEPAREQAPPPRPLDQTGAGDWEPPPPRDDWFETGEFDDEGAPDMAAAARTGRRRGDDGDRGGGILGALLRHPFRILVVLVLIVILLFLNALFQPFHGSGSGRVAVDIPKGSSVGEVGELLEKKGVISGGLVVSPSTLFQARVTIAGKRSDLFAGKFAMKKDMSYGEAIDQLTQEPKPAEVTKPGIVTVTIPEGNSRPLVAKLVKEDGIKGNYLKATKKSKYLNPEKYGGKNVKSLEGFLFPDTWEVKTKEPVSYLVRLQLEDFKKQIKKVNMKYARSKNLTVFDVVTIASMIEREAGVPKQRKLVASVIYNRLHDGMTLGIDSTIRFATGNYEKPLTQSQLESNSPYNTRTHVGLPPGPINSPGLAAIQAAAHPAHTDFLFYVTDPNGCDELTFAKTEEEFLADAERYEKAREGNGGNQPSTCK